MIASSGGKRANLQVWKIVLAVVVAALLYLAFRQAPIRQIISVLSQLQLVQVCVLIFLNLIFLLLVNFRWWLLLRSLGWAVSLHALFYYRLAGFSVSYLTPAPQFGGEPLQVFLLHNNEGISLEDATLSVFLDRLIDMLANFTFLFSACLVLLASETFTRLASGWELALRFIASNVPCRSFICAQTQNSARHLAGPAPSLACDCAHTQPGSSNGSTGCPNCSGKACDSGEDGYDFSHSMGGIHHGILAPSTLSGN